MKLDLHMHGKITNMQTVKSHKHDSGRTCKYIDGKIQQLQHAKQDIQHSLSHNRLHHVIDYEI